jgi:hypothetical protein
MSVSSGFSIVAALRIHPIGGCGHIRKPHGASQRYIEFRDAAAKVDPTSHMETLPCPIWKNSAGDAAADDVR